MIYQVNLGLQSIQAMMLINVLGYTPLKRKRVKGKYNLFNSNISKAIKQRNHFHKHTARIPLLINTIVKQ